MFNEYQIQQIRTGKMTYSELFLGALDLYKDNFKVIALIALLLAAPTVVFIPVLTLNPLAANFATFDQITEVVTVGAVILNILYSLASVIGTIVIALIIEAAILEKGIDFQKFFKKAFSKIPILALFGLLIMIAAGVVVLLGILAYNIAGALLTVLFGVVYYWVIRLSFAFYAIIFWDLSIPDALERSSRLVKDNWWYVFGLYFFAGVAQNIVSWLYPDRFVETTGGILIFIIISLFIQYFFSIIKIMLCLNLNFIKFPKTTNPTADLPISQADNSSFFPQDPTIYGD